MPTSACLRCGDPLAQSRHKWCSEKCRWAEYRERVPSHRAAAGPHTCQGCGKIFEGRKRKYCSTECRLPKRTSGLCRHCGASVQSPRHRTCASCASEHHRPKGECEICGKSFRKTYTEQRTCGRDCGLALKRRNRADAELRGATCPIPWRSCLGCDAMMLAKHPSTKLCEICRSTPSAYYQLLVRPQKLVEHKPRPCRICDREFVPQRTGKQGNVGRAVYCSDDCRVQGDLLMRAACSHRRRVRKRNNGLCERFTLVDVAARDGWDCHICGEPVDRGVHYNDDWSATLDHLIPVALGGMHTMGNVAIAHRWCNSIRGASDIDLARALVGAPRGVASGSSTGRR